VAKLARVVLSISSWISAMRLPDAIWLEIIVPLAPIGTISTNIWFSRSWAWLLRVKSLVKTEYCKLPFILGLLDEICE